MLISEIYPIDVINWWEQVADAPDIIIKVINGSWSYRDLAEAIAIWTNEDGIDD